MSHSPAQRAAIARALAGIQHLQAQRAAGAERWAIEARAAVYVRDALDALGAEALADAWAMLTAGDKVQM